MSRYIKIFDRALPPALCQELIKLFEVDKHVEQDPQPDYSRRRYLNTSLYPEWKRPLSKVARVTDDLVRRYFTLPKGFESVTPPDWLDDGYILACYDTGDTCILHVDGQNPNPPNNGLRIATVLFYLNTIAKGGETHFPLQHKKIKPQVGRAAIFPPSLSHPHETLPAGEKRYILQTWITDPALVVNWAPGG